MTVTTSAGRLAREQELARQQAFVDALFAGAAAMQPPAQLAARQRGAHWSAVLSAYRANGAAHADEALSAAYPTVRALLGEEAFATLAVRHWHSRPPTRGDQAWAGEEVANTVAEQDEFLAWPWLADCARLDWARWRAQHATPSVFGAADLERLQSSDPDAVRLVLADGTCLVVSAWPVVAIWQVHQQPEPSAEDLRSALACGPQAAWIWRMGWEVAQRALSPAEAQWIGLLRQAPSLGAALDAVPDDVDVAAWLQAAVTQGWLDGVVPAAEMSDPNT